MVTKRTPIARAVKVRITSELLDTYSRVRHLWRSEQEETDEWRDATHQLHQMLQLKPWAEAVEHCIDIDEAPAWMRDAHRVREWWKAHAIRLQLDEALAQRGA